MNELEITKAALAVGWVKFSYYKADGSKRVAIGTTNRALIDSVRGYHMNEYRENKTYYSNNGYFDLSRGDWRQFNSSRFIGLELDRVNNEQAVTIALTIAHCLDNVTPSDFERIRKYSISLVGIAFVERVETNIEDVWDYNNTDEFTELDRVVNVVISHSTSKPKTNREKLIAELLELRKRESEILAELLLA